MSIDNIKKRITATISGPVTLDTGSAVIGSISNTTFAVTQGTSPWVISGTISSITNAVSTTSAANSTASGTIAAAAETVECTISPGASTVGIQLTGTWAGVGDLVIFEATVNGSNWENCYANLTSLGSIAVITSGLNGLYQMAVAGYAKVRVRGHTWGTPGVCLVSFNSTVGSSASLLALPMPPGTNVIGKFGIDQTTDGTTNKIRDIISGRNKTYTDASFIMGDSPVIHDVNTGLGRNGTAGVIENYGTGNVQVEISDNGVNWGDPFVVRAGKTFDLQGLNIDSIRMTWITDTSYQIVVW